MIDLNQFPMHKKPYADNTLRCMPRKELIEYIRDIEHNYEALYWFYQNAVNANLDKFKDFERVVHCRDCLKKDFCSLYREANQENGFCAWADRNEK